MTKPEDAGKGRDVIVRWRILAARRLDHLVELYQSGRWKLYYKEPDFLKLIQEARAALRSWEALAPPDPVLDKVVEIQIAQTSDDAIDASAISANDIPGESDLRKS